MSAARHLSRTAVQVWALICLLAAFGCGISVGWAWRGTQAPSLSMREAINAAEDGPNRAAACEMIGRWCVRGRDAIDAAAREGGRTADIATRTKRYVKEAFSE